MPIGPPKTNLGEPNKIRWSLSSEQYAKDAVKHVEEYLAESDAKLKTKAPYVLPSNYRPEMDVSDVWDEDEATFYMSQIEVLLLRFA